MEMGHSVSQHQSYNHSPLQENPQAAENNLKRWCQPKGLKTFPTLSLHCLCCAVGRSCASTPLLGQECPSFQWLLLMANARDELLAAEDSVPILTFAWRY